MKKQLLTVILLLTACVIQASTFTREVPVRQHGKEAGMLLDLGKISMGTLNDVEEKKQYLSTVQLEKQRIQNYTLRMVYENAYLLYKRGDYQRAQEMAQTILSIDPNFKQAQTLAKQASHMGTYGTTSEQQVIDAKFQEAERLYDSGRLVEANDKLNEILTIQPGNSKAQSWKRKIDYDIAQEYARRGDIAEKKGDYQKALDAWYNSLLMRKNDPKLVAKIADAESKLRKQQVQESMKQALDFYNRGQYTESYAVFERITKIQPGDPRVQKYMSQLKNEIAGSYYEAGIKSYNSNRFDQAISYWNNSKKWGADSSMMDSLIQRARTAKENFTRVKTQRVVQAQQEAIEEERKVKAEEEKKAKEEDLAKQKADDLREEVFGSLPDDDPSNPLLSPDLGGFGPGGGLGPSGTGMGTGTGTGTGPGGIGTSVGGVGRNETLDPLANPTKRVTAEAAAASHAKYIEGLDAYHQDDYERAKAAWTIAKQLDPGNSDADIGLRQIEEFLK